MGDLALRSLHIPIFQLGTENRSTAYKHGWNIEFIFRSTYIASDDQSHSVSLVAQRESSQWHVRVTFLGEPSQEKGQKPYWAKRWRDFKALCLCIDFDSLPLLDDKFTELLISPGQGSSAATQLLPLKDLPGDDSDYAAFQTANLWFHVREYHDYTHFPLYTGSGPKIHLRTVQRVEDIAPHVNTAYVIGEKRQYVFKGVERLVRHPQDTKALEQELRNLEMLRGSERIVQLAAAVTSCSPYQTRDSGAPPVLRGILLEHHPNGNLQNALQSPESWMRSYWLQWALDIALAIGHMHRMGVTHMDLKPTNVVLSKDWNAILIDVGGIDGVTNEFLLPELYEVIEACLADWNLRVQSDTWALGKILALMVKAINEGGKAINEGGREEDEQLLLDIAREIENAHGCVSLDIISSRISRFIASQGV